MINLVTYYFAIVIKAFNRVNIEAISDINLNHNCLIALENVTVRSQLRNGNTSEITNGNTKITYFEVTMKKFSRKLKMLKIASNKCHQFFQQNKIKELEIHCKTYEECVKELNNLKSKVQQLTLEKD